MLILQLDDGLALRARLAAGNGNSPRFRYRISAFFTMLRLYRVTVDTVRLNGIVDVLLYKLVGLIDDFWHINAP